MTYQITGLPRAAFDHLIGATGAELTRHNA